MTALQPTDRPTEADQPAPSAERRDAIGLPLGLCMLGTLTVSFNEWRIGPSAVSDLFFLGAVAAVWAQLLMGNERGLAPREHRRGSPLVLVGTLLMLTGGALSSARSWTPLQSVFVMVRLGWLTLVWFWIARTVCRDRDDLWRLVKCWQVSLIISACVALLGHFGIAFSTADTFGEGRQAAFAAHPGDLMNLLVGGLPLFIISVVQRGSRTSLTRSPPAGLAMLGLIVMAIFSTGSMSGLVAGAAGLFAVTVAALLARPPRGARAGRWRSPAAFLALLAVAVVGLIALFNSEVPITERLENLRSGGTGVNESVEGRGEVNRYIIATFDDYLVTGVGLRLPVSNEQAESEGAVVEGLENVHNVPLKMLYEAGLIAFVGLLLVLGAVARQAYRLVVATRGTELHGLALGLVGGVTTAYVSSLFGPGTFARFFWLTPMLVGCLWTVRRQELREKRRLLDLGPESPDRQVGGRVAF